MIQKLASPQYFYQFSGKSLPWIWLIFFLFLSYGLVMGLGFAPADYQQGDAFRIIYIHVPSAALSMAAYMMMGMASISRLVWHVKLADVIAKVIAPVGAIFTLIALMTGSLWAKPMWGTFWIWDARLTSELILLMLFLGVIALRSALPNQEKAAKACAILTIVGMVDIPIIHYSVYWWNTLHQQSTLLKLAKPSIAPDMLWPLVAMMIAFFCYFAAVVIMRARCELLAREAKTEWVKNL